MSFSKSAYSYLPLPKIIPAQESVSQTMRSQCHNKYIGVREMTLMIRAEFESNPDQIDEYLRNLKIRVVEYKGEFWALDHRRLVAIYLALSYLGNRLFVPVLLQRIEDPKIEMELLGDDRKRGKLTNENKNHDWESLARGIRLLRMPSPEEFREEEIRQERRQEEIRQEKVRREKIREAKIRQAESRRREKESRDQQQREKREKEPQRKLERQGRERADADRAAELASIDLSPLIDDCECRTNNPQNFVVVNDLVFKRKPPKVSKFGGKTDKSREKSKLKHGKSHPWFQSCRELRFSVEDPSGASSEDYCFFIKRSVAEWFF